MAETAPDLDFRKLTSAQQRVVHAIAVGFDSGHNPKVCARLVELGFIEEHEETLPGFPPVRIKAYTMPIHAHIRWAAWCSTLPGSDP
jgi:hypothetical protein